MGISSTLQVSSDLDLPLAELLETPGSPKKTRDALSALEAVALA